MTTATIERMLPLYEGKMIHQYDHRWATYDGLAVRDVTASEKADPAFVALPRYWVRQEVVDDVLRDRWSQSWLLGWRDICRATDERTMISSFLGVGASPEGGVLLALPSSEDWQRALLLLAVFNSFVFDFSARQKVGSTHLKYFTIKQLPVPKPSSFERQLCFGAKSLAQWLMPRLMRLVVTADDIANAIPSGINPVWVTSQRAALRAEVDAVMFHFYGVLREDVDYVMDTFRIVKETDEVAYGEYRTKRLILEVFDAMQKAIDNETEYHSDVEQFLEEGIMR